tara:strand:- start:480 stop:716 length:237 start_codon:yes stop_codon:yes gene_type:complete
LKPEKTLLRFWDIYEKITLKVMDVFLGKFSNNADLCNKPVFSNNGSGEGLQTNSTIFYDTYLENYHASGQKPLYNYSG